MSAITDSVDTESADLMLLSVFPFFRVDGSTTHVEPVDWPGAEEVALSLRARVETGPGGRGKASPTSNAFTLSVLVADGPVLSLPVDATVFGSGFARSRFVTQASHHIAAATGEDPMSEAAADAVGPVEAALDTIGDAFASGAVQVVDEPTETLLRETAAVRYNPDAETWTVLFDREGYSKDAMAYIRPHLSLSAAEWARPDAAPSPTWGGVEDRRVRRVGASLPDDVFNADGISREHAAARWRVCRAVWSRQAEVSSEPLPVSVPISEEALQERSGLPNSTVDLETFVELVEERDYLNHGGNPDVNSEIGPVPTRTAKQAIQALGLTDELEDVDSPSSEA